MEGRVVGGRANKRGVVRFGVSAENSKTVKYHITSITPFYKILRLFSQYHNSVSHTGGWEPGISPPPPKNFEIDKVNSHRNTNKIRAL